MALAREVLRFSIPAWDPDHRDGTRPRGSLVLVLVL